MSAQSLLFSHEQAPEVDSQVQEGNDSESSPIVLDAKLWSMVALCADSLVQNKLESRKGFYEGDYSRRDCDPIVTQRLAAFRKKLRHARHKNPFDVANGFLEALRQKKLAV